MINKPIGIFDSGIGGLSIFNAVVKELPNENIIYFADSNRCPYGGKTQNEVKEISKSIIIYLKNVYDIKLAIVACNTATVASIQYLREEFPDILFVGVVPVIKPASMLSKTKNIACFATEVTVGSKAQTELIDNFSKDVQVHNVACHGLVELVEQGLFDNDVTKNKLKEYIAPVVEKNIDILALGCTHYTFLRDQIENLLPEGTLVLDSNKPVAEQTRRLLRDKKLLNERTKPKYEFLVNGDPNKFKEIVRPFLNSYFKTPKQVLL
jgi:glutamate racemase